MPKHNLPAIHRKIKETKLHLTSLLIVILIIVSAGIVSAGTVTRSLQPSVNKTLLAPTPTPLPNATFTSTKLGISFNYIPYFPNGIGQYFFTKEIDNRVYLYFVAGAKQPFVGSDSEFMQSIAPDSKYVEVLNKNTNTTLADTLQQNIMAGYSQNDCLVKATKWGTFRKDKTFQTAVISANIPPGANLSYADIRSRISKCPSYVSESKGLSYFMMDPKHKNKLLFIQLGQDNIPSGINGYTWDETIEIK